ALALESYAAQVVTAGSCADALAVMDRWQPDLLISDIQMPEADGYDLIRQVRERQAARGGEVPALALTAYARSEDRLRAIRAGFQAHLAKPIDLAELVAVIAGLTGRAARP
nr:response regulator [Acidobacteriota bacterium]